MPRTTAPFRVCPLFPNFRPFCLSMFLHGYRLFVLLRAANLQFSVLRVVVLNSCGFWSVGWLVGRLVGRCCFAQGEVDETNGSL